MLSLAEEMHKKRLDSNNIVVCEKFLDVKTNKILVRSSDLSKCDSIFESPKIEKEFFLDGKSIYKDDLFNHSNKYTYCTTFDFETEIECPCCGFKSKASNFKKGCPYCDADFFFEIGKKKLSILEDVVGTKFFVYGMLILFVSMFAIDSIPYEYNNLQEKLMSVVGMLISLFMFSYMGSIMIFLIMDSFKKPLWQSFKNQKMRINEQRVYNDLNHELHKYYYNNDEYHNLIDFDIIEYISAEDEYIDKNLNIVLTYEIRKYFLDGEDIKVVNSFDKVRLKRNLNFRSKKGVAQVIKCKNCGSSLNNKLDKCEYCGSKNDSLICWTIDSFIEN